MNRRVSIPSLCEKAHARLTKPLRFQVSMKMMVDTAKTADSTQFSKSHLGLVKLYRTLC